jgi:DNA-binding helix-turn-helix protein
VNYCSVALFPFSEVGECLDKAVFVQNIKKYCAAKGVKPTVACRESGVGSSFINNIESRGQVPSVEKVQLLAQYLGVTVGELLGEDPSKSTNGPPRPYLVFRFNQLSPKSQEDVMAFVEYRWVQDQKEKADEEPKTP